jgi:hypothetical protein
MELVELVIIAVVAVAALAIILSRCAGAPVRPGSTFTASCNSVHQQQQGQLHPAASVIQTLLLMS